METNQKRDRGVPSILHPKKPLFWIVLTAVLCAVGAVVCILVLPKKNKAPKTASDASVVQWLDDRDHAEALPWDEKKEISIDAFPGAAFRRTSGSVEAIENGKTRTLFTGMPVTNVYLSDVTGDGKPELCATVLFGSGIVDEHIVVYDYASKQSYTLWERGNFDYHLHMTDGALYVIKTPYMGDKQVDTGTIGMHGGELFYQSIADSSRIPLARELHESELYGEWLVQWERDDDGNMLYALSLDLWKEYNFREDGTVVYNETNPVSSVYEKAFGRPITYSYLVLNNMVFIGDDRSCYGSYDRQADMLELQYRSSDGSNIHAALTRMGASADILSPESETLTTLRERVPEFFDLPTENGLTVYVFPKSAAYYTCGLLAGTDRKENRNMTYLCKITLDDMKLVLSAYDVSPDRIEVRVCSDDLSSYHPVVDDAYIAKLRSLLFDS